MLATSHSRSTHVRLEKWNETAPGEKGNENQRRDARHGKQVLNVDRRYHFFPFAIIFINC